jgi:carboxypeptidase T
MHSNAALVLWPWGDTETDSPNVDALSLLGHRIAYFNHYVPEQSNELYFTDGTTDDSMYGLLGVASYTIETDGFDFFEDCDTFESTTSPQNLDALRYISRTLHAPYKLPAGPDTIDVTASVASLAAGDPLTIESDLDSGHYRTPGAPTVHPIASAAAYLDTLPWADGATPIALTAEDGAFDSRTETAQGAIPTSGLREGRHFVYVQASDDAGNVGTPNAAFFDVVVTDRIFGDGFDAPPG